MTEQTEQPEKECPMCAGTGKVPDLPSLPGAFNAATYVTIDPATFKDLKVMYGT